VLNQRHQEEGKMDYVDYFSECVFGFPGKTEVKTALLENP
jgi:hypothetical protein